MTFSEYASIGNELPEVASMLEGVG